MCIKDSSMIVEFPIVEQIGDGRRSRVDYFSRFLMEEKETKVCWSHHKGWVPPANPSSPKGFLHCRNESHTSSVSLERVSKCQAWLQTSVHYFTWDRMCLMCCPKYLPLEKFTPRSSS